MKTGLNLTQLATEIERRAAAKRDLLAPSTKLSMSEHAQLAVGAEMFPVNGLAHAQLADYVGIPKQYYDRMLQREPQLLARNVNGWLAKEEYQKDRRMVRTLDGNVRAFLSDRYRPLENEDLAEAVLPVLMDMNVLIASSEITERRMYIKAIDRRIMEEVPTGTRIGNVGTGSTTYLKDVVFPAIIISNSEVGAGRLSVESGIFTQGCTNLAMVGHNFKKHHVGGKADLLGEDVQHMLSDNTKRLADAAVWATVRDVIKGAFEAEKFKALTAKLRGAAEDPIDGDVVEVVNRFTKRSGIGEETGKSVLRHLIESANLTRYGLHAAVTRASADVEDYDVATEMERIGGSVIEMPKQVWRELLAA